MKATLGLPIARIGDTEDVAALVSYLASDSSGFVTGKTVQLLFYCHMHKSLSFFRQRSMCMFIFLTLVSIFDLTLQQISIDGGYNFD